MEPNSFEPAVFNELTSAFYSFCIETAQCVFNRIFTQLRYTFRQLFCHHQAHFTQNDNCNAQLSKVITYNQNSLKLSLVVMFVRQLRHENIAAARYCAVTNTSDRCHYYHRFTWTSSEAIDRLLSRSI